MKVGSIILIYLCTTGSRLAFVEFSTLLFMSFTSAHFTLLCTSGRLSTWLPSGLNAHFPFQDLLTTEFGNGTFSFLFGVEVYERISYSTTSARVSGDGNILTVILYISNDLSV